ncbi:MAG: Amuc_1100 family pilus-like protein [Chthoniobacterales bacterium]
MKKWFEENRFLGTFLVALAFGTMASGIFLCWSMSRFGDAEQAFDQQATELAALQRHDPFPTEGNLRKMKTQAEEYASALAALQENLKTRVLPVPAEMKPNEFQARLRQAMTSVSEKARENKVKLPENFFLGFEEFGAALPDTEAAPWLGQQLAQVELLMNILIDARVQGVTSLKRVPLVAAPSPSATPPARGPKTKAPVVPLIERPAIDLAFTGTPGAVRRVLNQISTVNEQLYVMRTLQIVNEKEQGPPRAAEATANQPAPGATPAAASALNFIVGNEHVNATARIEMVRFTF